jgi:hypothetical protein
MAEESDHETTRLRLLAMAADYEARATVAEQSSIEEKKAGPELTQPAEDIAPPTEASPEKPGKLKLGAKTTRALKETVLVEHRPTARRGKDPYP